VKKLLFGYFLCTFLVGLSTLVLVQAPKPQHIAISTQDTFPMIVFPPGETWVYVDPQNVTVGVGEEFSVSVKVHDVEGLYGLDLKLMWNTTFLEYASHKVKIPVQEHSDGVLNEPVLIVGNSIISEEGTYWIACSSLYPAPSFNGSGTAFEVTFRAIAEGTSSLELYSIDLFAYAQNPIILNIMNGTIEVLPGLHDIAVADAAIRKNLVGHGYCTRINVTIANRGGYDENVSVTLYANETEISTTSLPIAVSKTETVTFTWNTSGWAKGNYAMSAHVAPVAGEVNTTDNTLNGGWIFVSIPGDVDGDRDVDIYDVTEFVTCYCMDWIPNRNTDIDGDGDVDIYDVVILCGNYGKSWQT